MPFVVDASVSACWLLLDESDSRADAAFARLDMDQAMVPALWWFEIRNIFIINERRGRVDAADTHRALALLEGLAILVDRTPDESLNLAMARRHRLTVYDAAYLELALRHGLPLATLDAELSAAARAENIELLGT